MVKVMGFLFGLFYGQYHELLSCEIHNILRMYLNHTGRFFSKLWIKIGNLFQKLNAKYRGIIGPSQQPSTFASEGPFAPKSGPR